MFRKDGRFRGVRARHGRGAPAATQSAILSYCVLSNHWHFVVWPEHDGQLTDFFRRLAHTHAMRWRVSHRTVGYGHLYQGRFKSFPVQSDDHLLSVLRYVERNPLSAGLVERAQLWRWGSLWARVHGEEAIKALLSPWPVERPANWTARVNAPLTAKELDRVRVSIERGRPYGEDDWVQADSKRPGLGAHGSFGRPTTQRDRTVSDTTS